MESREFFQFLKLLADETRFRIIYQLSHKDMSVSDLCNVLEINQPLVSKHLVKLRLSGILNDVRDGSFVYYSLNRKNKEYITIIRSLIKVFEKSDIAQQDINASDLS